MRSRSCSLSFDAIGGIVRLRNCAATFRHRPRLLSISFAVIAFRKSTRFFGFAGLWQPPQFSTSTGRTDCENSCAILGAGAATAAEARRTPGTSRKRTLQLYNVFRINATSRKQEIEYPRIGGFFDSPFRILRDSGLATD